MRRCFRRSMLGLLVAASMPVLAAAQAPATSEDLARRQYEFGLESVKAGKYTEGLKDLEAVVDNYPASSAAAEALLAIAQYQLQVQRNPATAQATAESVQKRFPASDAVAMSYVIAGQAMVARGLTPTSVEAALASFDRVQRLFPGSDAARDYDELMGMFNPTGKFDPKALDVLARSFVEMGSLPQAPDMRTLITEQYLPGAK